MTGLRNLINIALLKAKFFRSLFRNKGLKREIESAACLVVFSCFAFDNPGLRSEWLSVVSYIYLSNRSIGLLSSFLNCMDSRQWFCSWTKSRYLTEAPTLWISQSTKAELLLDLSILDESVCVINIWYLRQYYSLSLRLFSFYGFPFSLSHRRYGIL